MPIGDGQNWDESNPQQSTLANTIDSYERDIRIGVRARLANEHVWPASQTATGQAGQHTYVSLQAQTAVPTMPVVASVTQAGMIFMSTGALTFQNSAAQSVTLVNSGKTSISIISGQYSSTGSAGEMVVGASGGNLAILAPATTNGQVLISTSGAAPAWGFLGLGTWNTGFSVGNAYQATNDAFVTVYASGNSPGIVGLSDASNPPTTTRLSSTASGVGVAASFTMPVRKNDYWKITGAASTIYYLPIGS